VRKKVSTQAKIILQYPPPKMLPSHYHSKLLSIINTTNNQESSIWTHQRRK